MKEKERRKKERRVVEKKRAEQGDGKHKTDHERKGQRQGRENSLKRDRRERESGVVHEGGKGRGRTGRQPIEELWMECMHERRGRKR